MNKNDLAVYLVFVFPFILLALFILYLILTARHIRRQKKDRELSLMRSQFMLDIPVLMMSHAPTDICWNDILTRAEDIDRLSAHFPTTKSDPLAPLIRSLIQSKEAFEKNHTPIHSQ